MSTSNMPCAACKFLRRKCPSDCIFRRYFPPDDPERFLHVHKVYGASNVSKLLGYVPERMREETANSLVYEATARLRDPINGCVGHIRGLQWKLQKIRANIEAARKELAQYIGPAAYINFLEQASQQFHGLSLGGAGGHQPQYQSYGNPRGAPSSLMPPPSGLASRASVPQELMLMNGQQQQEMLMRDQQQQQQQQAQMVMMREQLHVQKLMLEHQQRQQSDMYMREKQPQRQPRSRLEQFAEMLMRNQRLCLQQPTEKDQELALALAMSRAAFVQPPPPQQQHQLQEQALLNQIAFGGATTSVATEQQQQVVQEQKLLNLGFPERIPGYDLMAFGGATIADNAEQQQNQLHEQKLFNLGFPDGVAGYDQMAFGDATTALAAEQQQQHQLFTDGIRGYGHITVMAAEQQQQQQQHQPDSVPGHDQMALVGATIAMDAARQQQDQPDSVPGHDQMELDGAKIATDGEQRQQHRQQEEDLFNLGLLFVQ